MREPMPAVVTPLLVLSLLVGPPIGSTDESVLDAPPTESTEPTPVEPAPAVEPPAPSLADPVTTPDPVVPEPELPASVALTPLPRLPLPPPPPPPSGAGRLVGGGFGIALGLGAIAVVFAEANREGGNPRFVAATFVPLGLTGIGVGSYLLARGAKARRNLLEWETYTGQSARPSGDGLIVAGTLGSLIGGVTLVAAGIQSRELDAFSRPLAPTLFAVGGASLAFGAAALTGGLLRRRGYRYWRQATFLSAVGPVLAPSPTGLSVGVRGQF